MNRTLLLAAAIAVPLAMPASAILTRPDRDDEEYRELATRYPSAIGLGAAQGSGVLIAPRWVLTSGREAQILRAGKDPLSIAGHLHEIQDIFVHPDYRPGGDADIALVFLRTPASGPEPAAIYRRADEEGQTARVVGLGATSRIGSGASTSDGLPRAAINTVDRVMPRTLGLLLKSTESASDLQGALASGDSGAPAYFEVAGRAYVAGIASPGADAGAPRHVGDWDVFTRVSAFAAWIDDVMSKAAVEEAARETAKPQR